LAVMERIGFLDDGLELERAGIGGTGS
jgi:hypothetical protein